MKKYILLIKQTAICRIIMPLAFCFTFSILKAQEASSPQYCTFVEKDGLVIVEMESANVDDVLWSKETELDGYTGVGYLHYYGPDYTWHGNAGKEKLTYRVRINQTGRYRFQMHSNNNSEYTTENNDVWLRFAEGGGVLVKNGEDFEETENEWMKVIWGGNLGEWDWTTNGENITQIYVDFDEPGVYTVEFAGRSEAFNLDRFTLYHSTVSTFHSLDLTKPESDREDCQNAPNQNPVVAIPLSDTSVIAAEELNFSFPEDAFRDPDSDNLSYSAQLSENTPLPVWLSFDEESRTFFGIPEEEDLGEYEIIVTANDGKGGTISDTFMIYILKEDEPSDNDETEVTSVKGSNHIQLNVYPNPADDFLFAELDKSNEPYKVRIINNSGRVLLDESTTGNLKLNLQELKLKEGLYYIQIISESENRQTSATFIKK